MTDRNATLTFDDGTPSVTFPVLPGTIGPDVVDIRTLYGKTGKFTYDPGYLSTAACTSKITYSDGGKGELLYRGYPIEQLAVQCDFLEVCYLLLQGELPNAEQKAEFVHTVTQHTMVHEQMNQFFRGFRRDSHPMAMLVGVVGSLSAFYHDSLDITDAYHRHVSAIRLIAKLPTLVAMCYKYSVGQPFVYPRNELSYTANFMRMMFSVPCEDYKINDVLVRALDRIFILHADHEQNASTSTVRLAGSSGANPFACIAAGIACLWGPAHGGANEAALNMLHEIGTVEKIPEYIARAKDKNDPFRLMGFGHRVYKNYDPRAKVMQRTADQVLKERGGTDPIFDVARELHQPIRRDPAAYAPKLLTVLREGYSGARLRADLIAGLTVAIIALPLATALAIASGASPDKGLVTAIVAGALISFLGGSRVQIGGPTGAFVVVVFNVIAAHGYDGLVLATLLAGIILVVAGYAGFGQIIRYIPHPVITGFTAGIAVIITSSQVSDFLGLGIAHVPADFLAKWAAYF